MLKRFCRKVFATVCAAIGLALPVPSMPCLAIAPVAAIVVTTTPMAKAQSPQERTEKLQNDTIKLITERLNAHDKALLELKREQKRGENPRYESPGYNPPPQPRPSTRRESGFPAGFRMFIGTREVFSEDEALGEAIAQCLRYNRGEGPRPKG